jgi:hypothetical protein
MMGDTVWGGRWAGQTGVASLFLSDTKLYALVWNTAAPEPKKVPFADTSQVSTALAISSDGRFLACSHGDDGLILLDVHEPASATTAGSWYTRVSAVP